jgi:hypothetical protein
MIALQAESLVQVSVTAQQLVSTQLAHAAELKFTPHAIVPPPEPLELPLEPLLEPLDVEHAEPQLAVTQLLTSLSALAQPPLISA